MLHKNLVLHGHGHIETTNRSARNKQERQCTQKRDIKTPSHNICCHGKAISITNSECVFVALVIQHAMHMHSSIQGVS